MIAQYTTTVDGQTYKPGDEIWELGTLVCVEAHGNIRCYEGLSKDFDKLPHYVQTGSSCLMVDTGELYKYEKSTDTWYKL